MRARDWDEYPTVYTHWINAAVEKGQFTINWGNPRLAKATRIDMYRWFGKLRLALEKVAEENANVTTKGLQLTYLARAVNFVMMTVDGDALVIRQRPFCEVEMIAARNARERWEAHWQRREPRFDEEPLQLISDKPAEPARSAYEPFKEGDETT